VKLVTSQAGAQGKPTAIITSQTGQTPSNIIGLSSVQPQAARPAGVGYKMLVTTTHNIYLPFFIFLLLGDFICNFSPKATCLLFNAKCSLKNVLKNLNKWLK